MKAYSIVAAIIFLNSCKQRDLPSSDVKFIGGEVAAVSDFPATIGYTLFGEWGAKNNCGAGKISNRRFLTAAHCVKGLDVSQGAPIVIRYGTSQSISAKITKVKAHAINQSAGNSQDFGLDLATIDIDVDTPQVSIAKISTTLLAPGDEIMISGYGCESDSATSAAAATATPGVLKFGKVEVKSVEALHLYMERYSRDGQEARGCPGDSGTPAYLAAGGSPYKFIVGINSYRRVTAAPEIWTALVRLDGKLSAADQTWLKEQGINSDQSVQQSSLPSLARSSPHPSKMAQPLSLVCADESNYGILIEFDENQSAGNLKFYVGLWRSDRNDFLAASEFQRSTYDLEALEGMNKNKLTVNSEAGDQAAITYDFATKNGSGKLTFKAGGGYQKLTCRRYH